MTQQATHQEGNTTHPIPNTTHPTTQTYMQPATNNTKFSIILKSGMGGAEWMKWKIIFEDHITHNEDGSLPNDLYTKTTITNNIDESVRLLLHRKNASLLPK